VLQASRNDLLSSNSPPSFRGDSAANIPDKDNLLEKIGKIWVHYIEYLKKNLPSNLYIPVTSGSELMGTGPHRLTQKLSQSNLLKNSKKR